MEYPKYFKLNWAYYETIGWRPPCTLKCHRRDICKGKGRSLQLKLIKTVDCNENFANIIVVCWTDESHMRPVSEAEVLVKLL